MTRKIKRSQLEEKIESQRAIIGRYKAQLSGMIPLEQRFVDERAERERLRFIKQGQDLVFGSSTPVPPSESTYLARAAYPFGTTYSNVPPAASMTVSYNPADPLWMHAPPTQRRRFWCWVYRWASRWKEYAFQRGGR